MEVWQSSISERNDVLLFNEVFRPLRNRVGFHSGDEDGLVNKLSSAVLEEEAAAGYDLEAFGRLPRREPGGIVGRERFLKRLGKLVFERDEKLVKIYGAEGSGKSAVALEFMQTFKGKFPGGMLWLNGNSMVWDVSHFLVNELQLQSYANVLEIEQLRQRFWKYLFDNPKPWLVILDDASDEALEWIPPLPMMKNGVFLSTSKSKSGRDESLRVELPLLSAKSLSDLVLRYANAKSCKQSTLSCWTDSFHLCRNLLGIRLIGVLSATYDISLDDLLCRYDAAASKSIMPDLGNILDRYKLKHHMENLENIGVIDTIDFVRGRPWTALEGLTRKELYLFERIQENLHRSRNRLSLKIICKMWRDILAEEAEDGVETGRELWELLRLCSFFNARYIPSDLVAQELRSMPPEAFHGEECGDLIYFDAYDGSLCVHATLLEAIRSIHQKNTERNRTIGKRVLTVLHSFCTEKVFPLDQKVVGLAECDDRVFRTSTMSILPHVFLAVGLLSELLLKEGVEDADRDGLPEDFVTAQITRRHSLFSVASGASAASAMTTSTTTGEVVPEGSVHAKEGASGSHSRHRRASSFVPSSGPILKQITRRFTPKGKRASVRVLLADLNVVQGLLLLVVRLGTFRIEQAEALFTKALQTFLKFDEKSLTRATRFLIAYCLYKRGKLSDAARAWEELLDILHDASQRDFTQASLGLVYASQKQQKKALVLLEDALKSGAKDLVAARSLAALSHVLKLDNQTDESVSTMNEALAVYDDLCPLSFMSAETHKFLSNANALHGKIEEALAHQEEAITIYSSTEIRIIQLSEAYSNMGSLLEAAGQYEKAADAYLKCLEQSDVLFGEIVDNPDNLAVIQSVASCYEKIGETSRADQYKAKAKEMRKRLNSWANVFTNLEL